MTRVIIGMAVSVDGFVADRDGGVSALYPDMGAMHASATLQEAIATTGAVLMGRRAFAMGDPDEYADSYELQAPIFVVTHTPPAKRPRENDKLTFTFVTDGMESAVRQAKAAAGGKNVTVVGGASTFQQILRAGLADEIHLDVRPVLLGDGLRLFEGLGSELRTLEVMRVVEEPLWTHMRYRVASGFARRAGGP